MSDNRRCVLVPSTMDRAGTDLLAARPDIETISYPVGLAGPPFHDLLARADGIALSVTPFGAAEMAAAPRLAVVARIGVGFDAVEIPALTARGVPLMTTGTANSTSVAEAALTMLLTLAKRHTLMDGIVRSGDWGGRFALPPMEIEGKTVLVVGYGRIGARTAAKCAALGMRVLVHDPLVPADTITAAGHGAAPDLDAALPGADFVTIHCPKSPETVGMFGAARLSRMKPGAGLVNTARGGIVDEGALYDALVSGHLRGAGLDVFADEPVGADNPLFRLPNVVLSPHQAWLTPETLARCLAVAHENRRRLAAGDSLLNRII